jgi:hypothetical protein
MLAISALAAASAHAQTIDFALAGSFSGTSGARYTDAVAVDFDLDGDLDLVATAFTSNELDIIDFFVNDGEGNFSFHTSDLVGAAPTAIDTGDFNDDGLPDLIITNRDTDDLSIFLADAPGAYPDEDVENVGDQPQDVVIGDVNDDGTPDWIIACGGDSTVHVFLSDASNSYTQDIYSVAVGAVGLDPRGLVVADLNDDGALDWATASISGDSDIRFNDGAGDFSVGLFRTLATTGTNSQGIVATDLDRDGALDLVLTSGNDDTAQLFFNDGTSDPDFSPAAAIAVGDRPLDIAAADFDRDGDIDFVTVNESSATVTEISRLETVYFTDFGLATGASPQALVTGDFDRDGDIDLAVPTLNGQRIDLFRNTANGGASCAPDLDGDGVVGAADLAGLIGAWGACP